MTDRQLQWARKLAELLAEVPTGIELIVRPGRADVVASGFEDSVLHELDMHYAPASINSASLFKFRIGTRIVPISEAI